MVKIGIFNTLITTIIMVVICLASCTPHTKHWETLMQVESFIEERLDSALTVLQSIDTTTLKNVQLSQK